jgi:hypothetical protein
LYSGLSDGNNPISLDSASAYWIRASFFICLSLPFPVTGSSLPFLTLDPPLFAFAKKMAEVWPNCDGADTIPSPGRRGFCDVLLTFPLEALVSPTDCVEWDEFPFLSKILSEEDIIDSAGAAKSEALDDCSSLGVRSTRPTLVDCDRFFRLKNRFIDFCSLYSAESRTTTNETNPEKPRLPSDQSTNASEPLSEGSIPVAPFWLKKKKNLVQCLVDESQRDI